MSRFHISNGAPLPCKAQPGNCPLGGAHFDSAEEAAKYGEQTAETDVRLETAALNDPIRKTVASLIKAESSHYWAEGELTTTWFTMSDDELTEAELTVAELEENVDRVQERLDYALRSIVGGLPDGFLIAKPDQDEYVCAGQKLLDARNRLRDMEATVLNSGGHQKELKKAYAEVETAYREFIVMRLREMAWLEHKRRERE